jgi:hypothetical protein
MTCILLTCADLGEFIKVVASATSATSAAIVAYLALTKVPTIINQRQEDLNLRREEMFAEENATLQGCGVT